ncbi:MAG: hypothetical protein IT379_26695 [Deltaproteobacteria bacterium]|nr:hypothetical protein [Deltaproteobacteria bacterium]
MARDLDTVWRQRVASSLDALAEAPLGAAGEPAELLVILERIGDALRMSLPLPEALRDWCRERDARQVAGAIRALVAEVDSWWLPGGRAEPSDDAFAFILRRRDAAESVKIGLVRVCISARLMPIELEGYDELIRRLDVFDQALESRVSRCAVEDWLEERAEMLGERPWTSRLPDELGAAAPEMAEASSLPVPADVSDATATSYITDGAYSRLVELAASRNSAFANDLATTIEAVRDAHECVSLVARRWLRNHQAAAAGSAPPVLLPVLPRIRLAAAPAAGEVAETPVSLALGRLGSLDAHARFVATRAAITLRVFPGSQSLASVALGDTVTAEPDSDGRWCVTISRTDEPVRLRVTATDGAVFDELLHLIEQDDES